jgi:heme-degrading monooxygenase HmoA
MSRQDARYVVIFKARINALDAEYSTTAQRMREKAFSDYGCVDFVAVSEGDQEIALSYWKSLEDIARWKSDPEHQCAQQLGREKWYRDFSVEIAHIDRSYRGK